MPELPEVEALAADLRERVVGRRIERVDVAAISALKTFDPPPTALHGREVTGAGRFGKFLDLIVEDPVAGDLHLVVHLARAGWLHYRDSLPPAPLKPGKGPIALRVRLDSGGGFDLTEQGTQKRLAAYLVRDPAEVPGVSKLGPDALSSDLPTFAARLRSRRGQVKGVLTDQEVLAGVGNAYSDEILHRARLSPLAHTRKLDDAAMRRLFEATRSVLVEWTTRLAVEAGDGFPEHVTAFRPQMAVHGKFREPCPVCGTAVQRIVYAENECNYCPGCQTNGVILADRALSRLLHASFPREA